MDAKRFTGVIGEEYRLFGLACPHQDEMQEKIGRCIKAYARTQQFALGVVEAGTGTGITSRIILNAHSRIQLVTIDNAEVTLNQAREAFAKESSRIHFEHGDLLETLRKMQSFDVFASAFTLHNFPHPYRIAVTEEVFRMLRPGGMYVNGDKYARANEALHVQDLAEQLQDFCIFDTIDRHDLKVEWTKHYLEDEKVKMSDEEEMEILRQIGFSKVSIIYRNRMEAIVRAIK